MVVDKIASAFPQERIEVVLVTTGGDKTLDKPIAEIGTRGVFVKELEEALLRSEVDLVVHSLKDMPTDVPRGLCLAAVLEREDPRDVLVCRSAAVQAASGTALDALPAGAAIATSSRRRAAQLSSKRGDLRFIDIRGNIDTRLKKLDDGYSDAIILAAAGLKRLGLEKRISQYFSAEELTPAAGQGTLAVECRSSDERALEILKSIDDPSARAESECERAFLSKLGGGCSVPIGALARLEGDRLALSGCVASLDGSRVLRMSLSGSADDPMKLGENLAVALLGCGAQPIVEQLRLSLPSEISPP